MTPFNPFDKSFESLEVLDLATLRTVTEGWYVEYKQQITSGESISKSLSALANTYGGWLFYGIQEESKQNSVAGTFLGIPKNQIDSSLQAIRSAAAQHINPTCHFDVKVLHGPCSEISLDEERAIICVVVPQSQEAPHIHRSGRIYRRVADSSDPVPEADRYMIEKLFERSKKKAKYYKKWHDKDPEFSKGESDSPFMRIMIEPNLWGTPRPRFDLTTDVLRTILNPKIQRKCHMPFDTVYSRAGGFVARQCLNNDPSNLTLTWDVASDLSGDILIPLRTKHGHIEEIRLFLGQYEFTDSFLDTLEKYNYETANVIDFNHLIHVLMSIFETQQTLLKHAGWPTSFNIKFKILNAWRTLPFIDVEYLIDHFRENGIPLSLNNNITTPRGTTPNTFIEIIDNEVLDNDQNLIIHSVFALSWVANALGVPIYEMATDKNLIKKEGKNVYQYFAEAGNRATAK